MILRIVPQRFTVDFEEIDGSPTESMSRDFWQGTGAVRTFRCASRDRIKLANEFLGYRVGNIQHLAHSYTDLSFLVVATSITTKPVGKISAQADNRFANYPKTDLVVTYSIPPETFEAYGGLVTITESIQEVSEFVTVPAKNLYWYVDGVTNELIDEFDAPSKINKLLEWTYEIRHAESVPNNLWLFHGKVNSERVYSHSLGTWWPAETLLCGSPSVVRERTFSSTFYNITLRFLIKMNPGASGVVGWNHYPRISDDTDTDVVYERMVRAIDAPNTTAGYKYFYPLADFSGLYIP